MTRSSALDKAEGQYGVTRSSARDKAEGQYGPGYTERGHCLTPLLLRGFFLPQSPAFLPVPAYLLPSMVVRITLSDLGPYH